MNVNDDSSNMKPYCDSPLPSMQIKGEQFVINQKCHRQDVSICSIFILTDCYFEFFVSIHTYSIDIWSWTRQPQPQPWQSKIVAGNKDDELYS